MSEGTNRTQQHVIATKARNITRPEQKPLARLGGQQGTTSEPENADHNISDEEGGHINVGVETVHMMMDTAPIDSTDIPVAPISNASLLPIDGPPRKLLLPPAGVTRYVPFPPPVSVGLLQHPPLHTHLPLHPVGMHIPLLQGYAMPPQIPPRRSNNESDTDKDKRKANHNKVERKRRDNINQCIEQLATMVPSCKDSLRTAKSHKGNVLQETIKYIKEMQIIHGPASLPGQFGTHNIAVLQEQLINLHYENHLLRVHLGDCSPDTLPPAPPSYRKQLEMKSFPLLAPPLRLAPISTQTNINPIPPLTQTWPGYGELQDLQRQSHVMYSPMTEPDNGNIIECGVQEVGEEVICLQENPSEFDEGGAVDEGNGGMIAPMVWNGTDEALGIQRWEYKEEEEGGCKKEEDHAHHNDSLPPMV